jgi:hypothetical protein
MDDPGPMDDGERRGQVPDHPPGGGGVEGPVGPQRVGQRPARDVLHHDEVEPVLRPRVVDRDEVRVRDPRGGEGLPAEALDEARVLRQPAAQDLQGDRPVEDPVGRAVDLGHAAASEELADRVAVGEHAAFERHPRLRLREAPLRPPQADGPYAATWKDPGLDHSHSIVPGGFEVTS